MTSRPPSGQSAPAAAAQSPGRLVALTVGQPGRSGTAKRSVSERARAARKWCCRWTADGPGAVAEEDEMGPAGGPEPELSLGLSWEDATLVGTGQLPPSVAYMQGRLKNSGDSALLLEVLAWSATPAFAAARRGWGLGAREG